MSDSASTLPEDPPSTAPASYQIMVSCFREDERAEAFGHLMAAYVSLFGRRFDLSALDGVTVGGDYAQALAGLDRGYEARTPLVASSEFAQGIAMTPP